MKKARSRVAGPGQVLKEFVEEENNEYLSAECPP